MTGRVVGRAGAELQTINILEPSKMIIIWADCRIYHPTITVGGSRDITISTADHFSWRCLVPGKAVSRMWSVTHLPSVPPYGPISLDNNTNSTKLI